MILCLALVTGVVSIELFAGEKFQIIKEFPNDLCQVRNIGPGPAGRVGLLSKSHLAKDESFNDNPYELIV